MKKFLLKTFLVIAGLLVVLVVALAVRLAQARGEVEREWQIVPQAAPGLPTTARLEILPLYDEEGVGEGLIAGHGVSYLIRTDTAAVLMDAGYNPDESAPSPLAQNLQTLGLTWEEIDAVVITHPHPDHLGGVGAWRGQTISFGESPGDLSHTPIYAPVPLGYLSAPVIHSQAPTVVGPGLATTGAIAHSEVFPIYLFAAKGYEQGLVVNVAGEGLVLISGCGHPTLERLVARAEGVYGQPVAGVVGGLHYEAAGADAVQPHIAFLAARQPKLVALSPHDSGPEAVQAFQAAFPDAYRFIRVGEAIQFP